MSPVHGTLAVHSSIRSAELEITGTWPQASSVSMNGAQWAGITARIPAARDACTPDDSNDCDPASTPACAPSFPDDEE